MRSGLDRAIMRLVSQDLPLAERPFAVLAARLGIPEGALLGRIRFFRKSGALRKYAAALNHRKAGFRYNAMVAWDIPDRDVEKAGRAMAAYAAVSHCYERKRAGSWEYNLYSMIHGRSKKDCLKLINEISEKIGFNHCKVLFSSKEYKKTGVKY